MENIKERFILTVNENKNEMEKFRNSVNYIREYINESESLIEKSSSHINLKNNIGKASLILCVPTVLTGAFSFASGLISGNSLLEFAGIGAVILSSIQYGAVADRLLSKKEVEKVSNNIEEMSKNKEKYQTLMDSLNTSLKNYSDSKKEYTENKNPEYEDVLREKNKSSYSRVECVMIDIIRTGSIMKYKNENKKLKEYEIDLEESKVLTLSSKIKRMKKILENNEPEITSKNKLSY